MRIEDLDAPRVVAGSTERLLRDLAWLGLDWDEGPDIGGPHAPYEQSARHALYDVAFTRLRDGGFVYPCFCSRRDIQAAASAPQAPGDEVLYPGTCRDLDPERVRADLAAGRPHAWRFRVETGDVDGFDDAVCGRFDPPPGSVGDFVVRRADGVCAYQLAVVVDDAAMEIDEVVRGRDLLTSTVRQRLLYRALGTAPPAFGHVPLLLGPDGVRLSKRHEGVTLGELREAGTSPEEVVGRLAALLGLRRAAAPIRAAALAEDFRLERLRGVGDVRI